MAVPIKKHSSAVSRPTSSQRIRVLLADDNQIFLRGMQRVLEEGGFEVIACPDGQSALAQLERARIDVVVLDYRMPHLRGTDVARLIRSAEGRISEIPIIGISVDDDPGLERQCLEAGMNAFLTKLSPPDAFQEAVESWAQRWRDGKHRDAR